MVQRLKDSQKDALFNALLIGEPALKKERANLERLLKKPIPNSTWQTLRNRLMELKKAFLEQERLNILGERKVFSESELVRMKQTMQEMARGAIGSNLEARLSVLKTKMDANRPTQVTDDQLINWMKRAIKLQKMKSPFSASRNDPSCYDLSLLYAIVRKMKVEDDCSWESIRLQYNDLAAKRDLKTISFYYQCRNLVYDKNGPEAKSLVEAIEARKRQNVIIKSEKFHESGDEEEDDEEDDEYDGVDYGDMDQDHPAAPLALKSEVSQLHEKFESLESEMIDLKRQFRMHGRDLKGGLELIMDSYRREMTGK